MTACCDAMRDEIRKYLAEDTVREPTRFIHFTDGKIHCHVCGAEWGPLVHKAPEQRDAEKARADAAGRALAGLIGVNFPTPLQRLNELLPGPCDEPQEYDYSTDDFRAAIHALALFCEGVPIVQVQP